METYLTQKVVTTISGLTYTGNVSSYVTKASNVQCYARPLDEKESSVNGFQYGTAFFFMFADGVDIKKGDKVVFEGETFGVEGVSQHKRGITLPWFQQALAVRER